MTGLSEVVKYIEDKHNIEIIFCVQIGSKCKGTYSKISDDDIRFVYIHKSLDFYIKLNRNNEESISKIQDKLDYTGFELINMLNMLKKINAVIVEWFSSPIVIVNKNSFRETILEIIHNMKNIAKPLIHNYLGVLSHEIITYEKNLTTNKPKLFLNMITPILTIYDILEKRKTNNNILELSIPKLIENVSKINEDVAKIKDLLNKFVDMKINCIDKIEEDDINKIVEFSRDQMTKIKLITEDKKSDLMIKDILTPDIKILEPVYLKFIEHLKFDKFVYFEKIENNNM